MAFMQAVKVIRTKRDITVQKRTDAQCDEAIRQIISNAAVERVLQQAALLGEEWEPC